MMFFFCFSFVECTFSVKGFLSSYMSLLLNLLNELGKKIKCEALSSILSDFPQRGLINSIIQEHECKILFII